MISFPKFFLIPLATALAVAAILPAHAEGPTLLTVTGSVENTNRGPVDPDYDKLFVFNDVMFDKAMEFDTSALESLPQQTIRADYPKGGDVFEFTGPLLTDVLDAAGASGETVTVRAMDSYAIEVPLEELTEKGAMIALMRDGKALGIGGLGPTQVVFPRAEREDLSDMPDDWWIYQVYNIVVE